MRTWNLTQKTETSPGNDIEVMGAIQLVTEQNADGSTTTKEVSGTIIKVVSDIEALRVRIDAALQVVKGELDDLSKGVDYFGIIFSNTPISMKVQEISRVITSVDGVRDIEYKNGTFDRRNNALKFYFTIRSDYGDLDYDKLFELPR